MKKVLLRGIILETIQNEMEDRKEVEVEIA